MQIAGWPFDADQAKRRQNATAPATRRSVDLGDGVKLDLVLVPAGEFVMGSVNGYADETPQTRLSVDAFWMGQFEITNAQYAQFDSQHDSRHEVRHGMQFGVQGWPLNELKQPVVRVSWKQAMAFCEWLAQETGQRFSLPNEAQWEYACRAGSATAFYFGELGTDFSPFANLADLKLRDAVSHPYEKENVPLDDPSKYDDWIPRSDRFNDGELVSAAVGKFQPNAWGLHDMHGNVWEWTSSAARPYPYRADDNRNEANGHEQRIVRGGSWRDRLQRARSSVRLSYRPYQRVYNVGFRVACPAP
jgi:formylglycine-generating enzyme required for sulfatase activity